MKVTKTSHMSHNAGHGANSSPTTLITVRPSNADSYDVAKQAFARDSENCTTAKDEKKILRQAPV